MNWWLVIYTYFCFRVFTFFFLSGFSSTNTDDSQDSRGREGAIFYSTPPLPPAHSDIYLQLCKWDEYHIFNRITLYLPGCYSMRFTTISNYHLINWWCDIKFLFVYVWLDSSVFLLQQFETENRWIRTCSDYHPYITSEPTNQVC